MQTREVRGIATSIGEENGYNYVKYHTTKVVQFNHNEIILDTGGYLTYTTKLRMNQAASQFDLGFQVYQKNFDWFVDYDGETIEFTDNTIAIKRS